MEFSRLVYYSNIFLSSQYPKYKRSIYNKINFNEKLIGLRGAKGIGKTTILHQYLNSLSYSIKEKLYISVDNPILGDKSILDIAEMAYKRGIKVLVFDEIHYQKEFEQQLKTIYDFFDIQVLFSGSSAIALSNSDLSRRAVIYDIPILSFKEYLELKLDVSLKSYSFEDIIFNHENVSFEIISKLKPLKYFDEYLDYGSYPFFKNSNKESYVMKLIEVINKTIESDLLYLFNIDISNIHILKKLLLTLCENPPGSLNLTSLSREIGINVRTLYNYIEALSKGQLIHLLYYNKKGNAIFQKPDKIVLNNPNLFTILCQNQNIGSKRESFFISQLYNHDIKYSKQGDYKIDDKYIFVLTSLRDCHHITSSKLKILEVMDSDEIGGKNKSKKQIKNLNNSFIVKDDIEMGFENIIPLWLFGFLY